MSAASAMASGAKEAISPFYIPATGAVATQRPRVLKRGDVFAVLDDCGSAQASGPSPEGLYFEDTRYLAQLLLTIDGARPLLLSSFVTKDNAELSVDLTNPDLGAVDRIALVKNSIHILSTTVLGNDVLFQNLGIRNFASHTASFRLEISFDADFLDIFEVRGTLRARRGQRLADKVMPDGVELTYRGLDAVLRRSCLSFDPRPTVMTTSKAVWLIALAPSEMRNVDLAIRCWRDGRAAPVQTRRSCIAAAYRRKERRQSEVAKIHTSNESFNDWVNRSRADLEMLITDTAQGVYPYAGIPWFSTAFGRDGIITALQCLWLDPNLAAGTLRFLAASQAQECDPRTDAEPGKILHESRCGEMANLGEVPFARYYGGVDATPLFVVLAAAYFRRTGDLILIQAIWPQIEAALDWMVRFGVGDGDGFVEYDRKSVNGLINQGWKDSADAVFHTDGRLAEAPIALAEVQAYVYAAFVGATELATRLGKFERATALVNASERLRRKFEEAFWLEDLGTYALALDGGKQACRVATSNAGHVLLGGLAQPERAARVAQRLVAPASFSHWGIRTLERTERRYNPMSYHNGSVWPHDNALIGMGFARYGLREPLLKVFTALFDASVFVADRRLPELFCGFDRRPGSSPTAYPVACIPQAWAAAAVFGLLGATLGISFDADTRRIRFTRPMLPDWMSECRICDLQLGNAQVDLQLFRCNGDVAVHVVRRIGDVEVAVTS